MEPDTKAVIAGLEANRSEVQQALFNEYYRRLVGLVHANLRGRIARRVDASDVALSAFRSFFLHAKDGDFGLNRESQLWALLVTITMNKLRNRLRYHKAEKRAMDREEHGSGGRHVAQLEPGPADIALLNDELEFVLSKLKPYHRDIGERILAGQDNSLIADETQRSIRTIRRVELELHKQVMARLMVTRESE